jgi:type I restriction enzyme S subunit
MSWRTVSLGECVRLASGGTPSKSNAELWRGEIPWVSCKDMKLLRLHDAEDHVSHEAVGNGTRLVSAGTILIVVRGMILAKDFPVAEAQRPLAFNQDLKAVTVLPGVESRFFLYWFLAHRQLLMSACDEAAHGTKRLQTDRLLGMPVYLPQPPAQRRIASILSSYDDLIENNARRIAILEEMARRIYEEWFVRFRFPGHEAVRMVESELGLVPEGWRVGTVTDVAVVYRGRSYKGAELVDSGGRPFVNLKCMDRDGGFRVSGLKRYIGEFKDSQTVRPGDMVMGITDMTQERRIVARVGRVSGLDADFGVFSMDLVRIASRGEYAEPYLYAMFRWSGFADEVKQHANGANVLHLLPARIEEFAFARPTPELAAKFADLFAPMLSLCDTLERKNANLRTTRDLLLPKLISGELDASEMPEPEALAA